MLIGFSIQSANIQLQLNTAYAFSEGSALKDRCKLRSRTSTRYVYMYICITNDSSDEIMKFLHDIFCETRNFRKFFSYNYDHFLGDFEF